jgi:DNA-binding transcriptional ArsR family regulator
MCDSQFQYLSQAQIILHFSKAAWYFDVHQSTETAVRDAVFRAIADPQRRKILKLLQQGSMTAGQIAARFDITRGSLSYHFNILKEAGLIRCERRSQEQVYSLNTSVFEEIATMLLELFPAPRSLERKA